MKNCNTKIRNILGDTVSRQLNAGHSQLVERLKKGYAQLQAKEQEEANEIERQETGKVTTVAEDVLVIGIGNCDYLTKNQCITKLETSINVKDNVNKTQPNPLVNVEDDANNTPFEPPLVDANDDDNKKRVFTIALRNKSKISGIVVENGVYRNL